MDIEAFFTSSTLRKVSAFLFGMEEWTFFFSKLAIREVLALHFFLLIVLSMFLLPIPNIILVRIQIYHRISTWINFHFLKFGISFTSRSSHSLSFHSTFGIYILAFSKVSFRCSSFIFSLFAYSIIYTLILLLKIISLIYLLILGIIIPLQVNLLSSL